MNNEPHDSSSDEELVFNTLGSSIDEAFGGIDDEDSDEVEEDDYSEGDYE